MTNTNDFRKYSYEHDVSYMLEGFNVTRSSAAPKRKETPEPNEEPELRVHSNEKYKTSKEVKLETKAARKLLARYLSVALSVLIVALFTVNSFAQKNELTRQIADAEKQISIEQSENVSLRAELDSIVSISAIEDYAVNKLHMTKVNSNQVQYIDVKEYKQQHIAPSKAPTKTSTNLSNN